MTRQRTTPNDSRASRKRTPGLVIAVGVLLVVAACLSAVAVFGSPFGSGSPKPAAAVTSTSPSPVWDTGPVTAGVDSSPSSTATATPSKAATATPSKAATATPSSTATATATPSKVATGGSGTSSGSGGGSSSPKPSKPATLACTLSIDAETAGVGTIMATREVTFKTGETVFDVLQRECKAAGIPMEFEYTPMYKSAYIEGINGLYEFDRGELSGWMYSVNDWFPNYGCSRYKLKAGDVVRWRYTCDLGKDIGGYYATGE